MFPRPKFSITMCAMFCASLFFAATVAAQAQKTATVSTSQLTGEVVQVEGNDLVVKLTTGELRTFRVPETRKFIIDGKELSVHDLQTGTTLTATVKTTTTPVTVRTKTSLTGRVWYAAAPTIILTLPDGTNKQYYVKDEDNLRFTVNGRPATVFELRKGMTVTAEKIVEEPNVEITTDTRVVGSAPPPALRAAATAKPPTPAPETAAPAPPKPAPSETAAPAPPEPEPAALEPAPSETTSPATLEPAAPETGGTMMRPLLWIGLIVLLIIIVVIVARKGREKK
jgi:LPXTG-motif cell wall-anchored protein